MSRWLTWSKSRSRRRRSVRPRILRIDELENRRLLRGTLLGGSFEEAFEHDEFEIEDRFEADERDDLPRGTTLSRDAVVDLDEAEGEDDEWEDDDESEPWSYANPATPVRKNQVPMDSVIAFRVTNAFWFGSVVVLDVSGTRDDDASAEEATPATNFARPANGSDKTIAASPTRTTNEDPGEAESSAPETDVRTDREAEQPSGGDETVTSESPAKTGPENLVAATASPVEEKAAENLDRKDAVSPTALSTRTTQDDGTLASPDEETQSQTASRTKAGSSSERLEMSSRRVDGPQRHPLIAEASVSRHTCATRRVRRVPIKVSMLGSSPRWLRNPPAPTTGDFATRCRRILRHSKPRCRTCWRIQARWVGTWPTGSCDRT